MVLNRCKGCKDLSPVDMKRFRLVEAIFGDSALSWGYEEIRTPVLEYLHLFTASGTLTPGMLKNVYSFLDWDGWSGERVVLRPDATIPIARMYGDGSLGSKLARLFYVSNVFRFNQDPVAARESWQCGAELIGIASPMADVELVSLALEALSGMDLPDVTLRLSHAGLIRTILGRLEPNPDARHDLFDQLLDGDEAIVNDLKGQKPELAEIFNLVLGLRGNSSGFLSNISAMLGNWPELEKPLADFNDILAILDRLGLTYQIDLASGRGFEYYTGMIFHLSTAGSIVGGGGRYNDLIKLLGGKPTPAAGFALYMDVLAPLFDTKSLEALEPERFLIRVNTDAEKSAFNVAVELRNAGYTVKLDLGDGASTETDWVLDFEDNTLALLETSSEQEYHFDNTEELLEFLKGEEDEECA